jgi:hypothetical protein
LAGIIVVLVATAFFGGYHRLPGLSLLRCPGMIVRWAWVHQQGDDAAC